MWNTLRTFEDTYLRVFRFFSVWVMILILTHGYTAPIFNLVFLAIFVLVGGLYIAFIYPRYYTFRFANIRLKIDSFIFRFLIEFGVHFMLLVYVLQRYGNTYSLLSWQTLNSIVLILAYYLFHNVKAIYHLRKKDIHNIVITFVIVYWISISLVLT